VISNEQMSAGAFREVHTSTMLCAGSQMPDHCLRILRALAQSSRGTAPGGTPFFDFSSMPAHIAMRPLQLAGWEAAALPPELQPYAMHLQALLPPW
jgi:hypothetical protein